MEWLLSKVASSALGAILAPVLNALLTAQKQRLDAAGSHEARVAELAKQQLELDQREAAVQAQIVVAEQGNWFTRNVRPLLGYAVVILVWKLLVYDKALGQWTGGKTDPLDGHLWWVVTTIIIAYMGGRSAEKIADKIAGVWKR